MKKLLNNNERYLITLLKNLLFAQEIEEKLEDVSFEEVLRIAKNHSIANMIYYAILKLKNKPNKEILNLWQHEYTVGQIKDTFQKREAGILKIEFEKNRIKNIFLKGFFLKKLYPKSDMRTMSDIDILILSEDRENCKVILEKLGYSAKAYGVGREDIFLKKPAMNLEIHNNLFDESDKVCYNYFLDMSLMRKVKKLSEYSYDFSLEDHFIYNLVHTIRHFKSLGTGIKNVIDHWLYIKKLGDKLDWEYINRALRELNILEFHEKLYHLGEVWFEDKESNEVIENLGRYILDSGVYGKVENYGINKGAKELLFPSVDTMKEKFPILKEKEYLLPFCYVIRGIKILRVHGSDKVKRTLKSALFSSKTDVNKRKKFYKDIGLDKFV